MYIVSHFLTNIIKNETLTLIELASMIKYYINIKSPHTYGGV